jgi:hypothetical protein
LLLENSNAWKNVASGIAKGVTSSLPKNARREVAIHNSFAKKTN